MSNEYIQNYDYYSDNIQPNTNVNPHSKGALWNTNNNQQLKCCTDATLNRNKWTRLNPEIDRFSKEISGIEDQLKKPNIIPPINGYKSQVIARYLVVDGDDGNGSGIAFGNRKIIMSPHYYGKWAGGDEYGAVALMLRDIGYLGTITRLCTSIGINTIPRSISLSNGLTVRLTSNNGTTNNVTGTELPLWPKASNYYIGKVRYYIIPSTDSRLHPYWRFDRDYCIYHDYYDLISAIPFPYDRYNSCRYIESVIPTTEVTSWKAVSLAEWNKCLDMRKRVSESSNTYLIPITNGNATPFNARDYGVSGPVFACNGLSVTLVDVYYMGEIYNGK